MGFDVISHFQRRRPVIYVVSHDECGRLASTITNQNLMAVTV